uniref:non-specific serine/threonine protein kinase n=2 Tax=Trichogramma kaykai TaxID=54128 RepID=A0ABD2W8V2_9HYME
MSICGSSASTKVKNSNNSDTKNEIIVSEHLEVQEPKEKELSKNLEIIKTPKTTVFICQKGSRVSSDHSFSKFKFRGESRNDLQMARGGNSGTRGRGSGHRGRGFKRVHSNVGDRDGRGDRSKFHESVKNHDNRYDDKRTVEDSKISTLLRRLAREDNYDNIWSLCTHLQESIQAPENQKYVKRTLDNICDSLLELLYTCTDSNIKQEVSHCIGLVGYVSEYEFKRYLDWIFKKISKEQKNEIKCSIMEAFIETLEANRIKPKLKDNSATIMPKLLSVLEMVETPELLIVTCNAILEVVDQYPDCFEQFFHDIVDILIGWHIDTSTSIEIVQFSSETLQQLKRYWLADTNFTENLLHQFFEDIQNYRDEMLSLQTDSTTLDGELLTDKAVSKELKENTKKMTSVLSVVNTVFKCVEENFNAMKTQWSSPQSRILLDRLVLMLETVIKALQLEDDKNNPEFTLIEPSKENISVLEHQMKLLNISDGTIEKTVSQLKKKAKIDHEDVIKIIEISKVKKIERKRLKQDSSLHSISKEEESKILELIKSLNSLTILQNLSKEKERLAVVANECVCHLLVYVKYEPEFATTLDLLLTYILLQLEQIEICWDDGRVSAFELINKIIQELPLKLEHSFVDLLLSSTSVISKLRFSSNKKINKEIVKIYSNLLSSTNIMLSQTSYNYILGDMENAYNTLIPNFGTLVANNPLKDHTYSREDAKHVLQFSLQVLTKLTTKKISNEGVESLQPNILYAILELQPQNSVLSKISKVIHYDLFVLISSLCKTNVYQLPAGIRNSSVEIELLNEYDITQLTAVKNLKITLDLIGEVMQDKSIESKVLDIVVDWAYNILASKSRLLFSLTSEDECVKKFFNSVIDRAYYSMNHKKSSKICDLFRIVLTDKVYNSFIEEGEIYNKIVDLIIMKCHSGHQEKKQFVELLKLISPHRVFLRMKNYVSLKNKRISKSTIGDHNVNAYLSAQKLLRYTKPTMTKQQFKSFMNYILPLNQFEPKGVCEIFATCWPIVADTKILAELGSFTLGNSSLMLHWAMSEAAQHCISNKLRTVLGKPQDTFMNFECALKDLAREISCPRKSLTGCQTITDLEAVLKEQKRVRVLVEFFEHLEKALHNATEGCAVSLPQAAKPVQSFFRTNASTCREWLKRVRLALCVVSLHAGLATQALRNGLRVLEDLSVTAESNTAEFERAVVCVARALVMLREPEALQGLVSFVQKNNRQFSWLQAAVEDAAGRYEAGAVIYKSVLETEILKCSGEENPEVKNLTDSQVSSFCLERISKCYLSLNDFCSLNCWKQKEAVLLADPYNWNVATPSVSESQAAALYEFDQACIIPLINLSEWTMLDRRRKTNWSVAEVHSQCENTLTNVAFKAYCSDRVDDSDIEKVKQCQTIAAFTMSECLRNVPAEFLEEATIMLCASSNLLDVFDFNGKRSKHDAEVPQLSQWDNWDKLNQEFNSASLNRFLWWTNYIYQFTPKESDVYVDKMSKMRLQIIKSARLEGNYQLAKRELARFFAVRHIGEIVQNVSTHYLPEKYRISGMIEAAKLLSALDKKNDALKVISYTATQTLITTIDFYKYSGENERANDESWKSLNSNVLLVLSDLIRSDADVVNCEQLQEFMVLEGEYGDGSINMLLNNTNENIPVTEVTYGKVMRLGAKLDPNVAKIQSNLASFCYGWGRKIVDNPSHDMLFDDDKQLIQDLLPIEATKEEIESVIAILNKSNHLSVLEREEEGDINSSNFEAIDNIENSLRSLPILSDANCESLSPFIEIWEKAKVRKYKFYEMACEAYFKFLQLNSDSNTVGNITATLRLLRLMVKHATELQSVLEEGLSITATKPWKAIIPQLFSRLTHPECYVRQRVSELLRRVAENSPHLITFPAVVGTISCSKPSKYQGYDSDDSQEGDFIEEEDNDASNGFMNECFTQMTDCLSKSLPESIQQVRILVKELRRITLLWDELWLATFTQHHADFYKRFEQLEQEIQKVQENTWLSGEAKEHLIAEKYRIIVKPIIFVLEELYAVTTATAETPHEVSFQEKYNPVMEKLIERLKNPKNPAKPHGSMMQLKSLENMLGQRYQKRNLYSLSMAKISPTLATMKDTCITMPGIISNREITIKSVEDLVSVLPTKTKPKKLIFKGSDGQSYTYLFKGLEDLHLDERIMQFLSVCNTMMSSTNDGGLYRARHYSVVPLGPRSGLIQWVDGVTPMFSLYKRWQQREVALKQTPIQRPTELFHKKLTPLLQERNISIENRKEWPAGVLKQVLTELINETPKDLLANEILCNSSNAGGWWQATKNYTYSMAVMSVIGYIIGLGDRHLDNILIDLNTGEVVHIDYNICFERGKSLRIPEKVPFRLTQNIKAALGPTGLEGMFRHACEHTLSQMRQGRETLLTLLEAFVYDPLVDWRSGSDTSILSYAAAGKARSRANGTTRKKLEIELTHAMFKVRVCEMRIEWLNNKDEVTKIFPALISVLATWIETYNVNKQWQNTIQERYMQLDLVQEAQNAKPGKEPHPLFTLLKRYDTFKTAMDSKELAMHNMRELQNLYQKQIKSHRDAIKTINKLALKLASVELRKLEDEIIPNIFDQIEEFLHNAGQSQMILQCQQSELELVAVSQQLMGVLHSIIDDLNHYSSVITNYPVQIIKEHRTVVHKNWASKLLSLPSVSTCELIEQEASYLYRPPSRDDIVTKTVVEFSTQIKELIDEIEQKHAYVKRPSPIKNLSFEKLQKNYEVARDEAIKYRESYDVCNRSFESALLMTFAELNLQFLKSEVDVKYAKCLVNHSISGNDWFVYQLSHDASYVYHLITLVKIDPLLDRHIECLKNVKTMYQLLQDFLPRFYVELLPMTANFIPSADSSFVKMMDDVDNYFNEINIPCTDLLQKLEEHLYFTIKQTSSPHSDVYEQVLAMRVKFENSLIAENVHEFLVKFNNLFVHLDAEKENLVKAFHSIPTIPKSWGKIDSLDRAEDMAPVQLGKDARNVLNNIFFVKRIKTMIDVFEIFRHQMKLFQGIDLQPESVRRYFLGDNITAPIRSFIGDFVKRFVLGTLTVCLSVVISSLLLRQNSLKVEQEIKAQWELLGPDGKLSLVYLCNYVYDLINHLPTDEREIELQQRAISRAHLVKLKQHFLERIVEITATSWKRVMKTKWNVMKKIMTIHYFMHEDHLRLYKITPPEFNRTDFINALRLKVNDVSSIAVKLDKASDQLYQFIQQSVQRLKWAAGANPDVNNIISLFDKTVKNSNEKMLQLKKISVAATTRSNIILQFESLRSINQPDTIATHVTFMDVLMKFKKSCMLTENLDVTVTPLEVSLVELLQLGANEQKDIDVAWLRQTEHLLSAGIVEIKKNNQECVENLTSAELSLKEKLVSLQNAMADHHRLINDVRLLLKRMSKQETMPGLNDFLQKYRSYTEKLSTSIKDLDLQKINSESASALKADFEDLNAVVPQLYDELLQFADLANETTETQPNKPKLVRQDSVYFSPRRGVPAINPATGKATQQQNTYALSVWRRIRAKLDGRDPNPARKVTVSEQIEYIIREALSIDNLSQLYEGWTPWV